MMFCRMSALYAAQEGISRIGPRIRGAAEELERIGNSLNTRNETLARAIGPALRREIEKAQKESERLSSLAAALEDIQTLMRRTDSSATALYEERRRIPPIVRNDLTGIGRGLKGLRVE